MSATVRDNIIFSHEYDETFYNLVLDGKVFPTFCHLLSNKRYYHCSLRT